MKALGRAQNILRINLKNNAKTNKDNEFKFWASTPSSTWRAKTYPRVRW